MALTGIIGALVALVPAAKRARQLAAIGCKLEDEHRTNAYLMQALVDGLMRSRAQLVDHIELLERELATERQMSAHWLAEAQGLIRERRRQDEAEADRAQAQFAQQSQSYQDTTQQQQQAQQNLLAQAQNQQAFAQARCNCVPSRAQVWGAQHGLVNQLNRGEA
jgi:hypothetical protein